MASLIKIYASVLLASLAMSGVSLAADTAPKDVVLLLDNSGSMQDNDPLGMTKVAVGQLLNEASSDTRIGTVVFDTNAMLVSGLTPVSDETRPQIASSLSQLRYNGKHTNIPAALAAGVAELGANGLESAVKSLVLVTDGIIDTGDKKRDRQGRQQARNAILADAKERGIRIMTVALGNSTDAELLREFAERTGGRAYTAERAEDLPKIFQELHQSLLTSAALPAGKTDKPASPAVASPPTAIRELTAADNDAETPTAADSAASSEPTDGPASSDTGKGLLYRIGKGIVFLGLSLLAAALGWIGFKALTQVRQPSLLAAVRGSAAATDMSTPAAYLEDFSGSTGRQYHELSNTVTIIGRAPGQTNGPVGIIVIPHPAIGRRHAVIEYQHHGFWLIDQNSKNGTFLNGEAVTQPSCLSHGDRIRFHDLEFGLTFAGMNLADDTLATEDLKLLRNARAAAPPPPTPAAEIGGLAQDRSETLVLKIPPWRAEAGGNPTAPEKPTDPGETSQGGGAPHPQKSKGTRGS